MVKPVGAKTIAMVVLGALAGCQGTEATAFPPGLEPLEDNTAEPPAPTPEDPYPEAIEIVVGESDDFQWGHGRAYIHASTDEVWAAISDPAVIVNRRESDDHSITLDIEPEYEHSFQIHYVVERFLTVEWDENWRYGVVQSDGAGVLVGAIRWQKVFGSTFIDLIEGSATVRRIDENITELELIEHVDAIMADKSNISRYMRDLFAHVLSRRDGLPLPEY
jgi:hypothetical protein